MYLNSKILTSALLVYLQKQEILQELGYFKVACLGHIKYRGVLFWNEIAVDWLSVAMWFGTYSCLGARMRTRGLVRSLFFGEIHVVWYT